MLSKIFEKLKLFEAKRRLLGIPFAVRQLKSVAKMNQKRDLLQQCLMTIEAHVKE